jgi:ketosteroid isomerase-like protein
MSSETPTPFERWLDAYGAAWEGRDPETAAALFTEDAEYCWTPFQEPKRGPAEIAGAWGGATSRQGEVQFRHTILADD